MATNCGLTPTQVLKDSESKPTKPAAKTAAVKRTPFIMVLAVVLAAAIVGGIRAGAMSVKIGNQLDASDLAGLAVTKKDNYFTFTFGNYPQGANGEIQPIEWRVLAVKDGRALVISEKLLDYVPYHERYTDVTWENCTLRGWLNSDFWNEAFSGSERAKIAAVTNQNPDHPKYGTEGGSDTRDRLFALSIDEAHKYFSISESDRTAYTTDYAHAKGYDDRDRSGWWWLRSPGILSDNAAYVNCGGSVDQDGNFVYNYFGAVRPAMWLNLE